MEGQSSELVELIYRCFFVPHDCAQAMQYQCHTVRHYVPWFLENSSTVIYRIFGLEAYFNGIFLYVQIRKEALWAGFAMKPDHEAMITV